jgi:type I restriction enzyme S subunit
MTAVTTMELQSVARVLAGGKLGQTGKDFVQVGYPAFGAGGLNGYLNSFEYDGEAIILSSIGARCGKVFYPEGKWSSLANTQLIFPDQSRVDRRFLWYQINDEARWHRSGTAQPYIKPSDIKTSRVFIPTLPEQRRIVAILDQADELRTKRRRAVTLLDELADSLFVEMFGDLTANSHGFPTFMFGELGQLDRGVSRTRPRNAPSLLGGPHPLIQTGDVANSGGYIQTYSHTYSDTGLAQSKMWDAGTLAITIAANIAKAGILTFPACFPDSVVGFRPNPHLVHVEYIRYWLASIQAELERQAPASAQRNINLAILRGLEVPTPSKNEQLVFADRLSSIQAGVAQNRQQQVLLNELFASLQHRAFRGEL